jgi:hypothetical protein
MYTEFVADPEILLFNLMYNFGKIYDGVKNVVLYFQAKEYTRVKDGFAFGNEVGQLLYYIFVPAKDKLS